MMAVRHSSDREGALEGLRGIAALSVLLMHLAITFIGSHPDPFWPARLLMILDRTPVSLIWSGNQAVLLFFALSGFVLHRMIASNPRPYRSYVLRRIFRLWPPYVAALFCGIALVYVVGAGRIDDGAPWTNEFLRSQLTRGEILTRLAMVGSFDPTKINPVVWSLVHEMRMSLVLPAIYIAMRKFRVLPVLAVSILISIATLMTFRSLGRPIGALSLANTLVLQVHFIVGVAIAHSKARIMAFYGRLPSSARWGAGLAALILYSNCLPVVGRVNILGMVDDSPLQYFGTAGVLLGAAWIIVAAISSPRLKAVLETRPLLALGRISYSLYLFHFMVLLAVTRALGTTLSSFNVTMVAFALSLVAAFVANRLIEEPSNRLGKTLTEPRPHLPVAGTAAVAEQAPT